MRNLVFKHLTSYDKKRRIIASCEIADNQGVHSIIRRHFICLAKEIPDFSVANLLPYLYIYKERNHKAQRERFFCKLKGSLYVLNHGKLYLIQYLHTLSINLVDTPQNVAL
jgi:hypothetical protein